MLPEVESDFEIKENATNTYFLQYDKNRIYGKVDNLDAMRQLVYIILNTERYKYLIYDWNFGVELDGLIGEPKNYVLPELEKRISDALMQDSRIIRVTDFSFETGKNFVIAYFTVNTIFGSIQAEKEVNLIV